MVFFYPDIYKTRGLDELRRRVGEITREIESRMGRKRPVRILEVGCGYGVALLELGQRYGRQIELHGINQLPEHGDRELMKMMAVHRGLYSQEEIQTLALPEMHYFDVCAPWPLPSDSFDIIYSQVAFLWFADKIKTLEEINRVLSADGIARIDAGMKRREMSPDYPQSIVILEGERKIPFWNYIQNFGNIQMKMPAQSQTQRLWEWLNRQIGRDVRSTKKRHYLELKKAPQLDFNLEFVSSRLFSESGSNRAGCQSVYRVRTA